MLKWLPYPMVRIGAFFTGGVLTGIYFLDDLSFKLVMGLLAFFIFCFFLLRFYSKQNLFHVALGFFGLISVFLFGVVRLVFYNNKSDDNFLSKIEDTKAYEAIVQSVPEEKSKSWKVETEVVAVKTNRRPSSNVWQDVWQPVTGKVLLYVAKENQSVKEWHYGDRILVKGGPQVIKAPANPGEFDFRRFLSFKNISYQQFVRPDNIRFVSATSWKGFIYYSQEARAWSMKKINKYIIGEDERAIAIALVLGVTDGIDNDLQNAYAASGAMHVLAVSGMHVGIIYAIILFLFKPLNSFRWSKWVIAIISLILLWTFAFVTGLSPSVLRAVTMFSFIAFARPFGKRTNIYNTLAASVFVLLIYNPYLIMSVGFQLSYLAVLGIVYLQQPIYNLWEIENRIGDWVWQITCVSIAAQIATFALGLFYFHQFPIYFLISNLFVIPLSTVVLVVGIFLLLVSGFSPIASFTAIVLEWLIKALNWTVFKTEALPFSLVNNIHISRLQCWLLMGILLALVFLFEFRSVKWLYLSFILTFAFTFFQWSHFFDTIKQKQMILYSINNHQAIEFISSGQSYFASDSALLRDAERIRFHVQPNRLEHGVSRTEFIIPFSSKINGVRYFRWNNKTIAWIDAKGYKFQPKTSIDYVIVSNNCLKKKTFDKLKTDYVILDGSNSKKFVTYLVKEMESRKIAFHSVAQDGAFIF